MTPNYIVTPTSKFGKQFERLSAEIKSTYFKKLALFEVNPFYPSLRSKKILGRPGYFEFSVNMDVRVIWRFDGEGSRIITLVVIGGHDIIEGFVRNK